MTEPATVLNSKEFFELKIKVISKNPVFQHVLVGEDPHIDMRFASNMVRNDITAYLAKIIGPAEAKGFGFLYPVEALAPHYFKLLGLYHEEYGEGGAGEAHQFFEKIFNILKEEHEKIRKDYEERVKSGKLTFEDVPMHFPVGAEVVEGSGPDAIAGTVVSVKFIKDFFSGTYWKLNVQVLHNLYGKPMLGICSIRVPYWRGLLEISMLPASHVDGEMREKLTTRGKLFKDTAATASYMRYKGEITQSSWFGAATYRADGRVMIDPRSCNQVDNHRACQEIRAHGFERNGSGQQAAEAQVTDEDLWRVFPFTLGFSFRTKKWGSLALSGVSPIEWRQDAYDLLVMPPEQKHLIKSLVTSSAGSFQDIVDEKGGGTIFLLEGPPGLGKTLTAETVAEMTRQPLYSISVGELGTDPETLESTLREILDVATMWNAVLLLDEADIFLEARNAEDIVRNAMVGVFLRLLEYHQGILFLTTNRASNLDPAFLSRISVPLSFPPADAQKMRKIWSNLLTSAGVLERFSSDQLDALAAHPVNGRQVKNAIRIGQTLARAEGRDVSYRDVLKPLALAENFRQSIASGWGQRAQGWWRGLWAHKPARKTNRSLLGRKSDEDDIFG